MADNVLTEEIKREFARVAAAFGVKDWTDWAWGPFGYWKHGYIAQGHAIRVKFEDNSPIWKSLTVGAFDKNDECFADLCEVWSNGMFEHADGALFNTLMSRGLYRLGIKDEVMVSQLPPLSDYEKLALRLSMPRDFWPQKSLDEEGAN